MGKIPSLLTFIYLYLLCIEVKLVGSGGKRSEFLADPCRIFADGADTKVR